MATVILDEDLVRVWTVPAPGSTGAASKRHVARMLYWGDEIDVDTLSELNDPGCAEVGVHYYEHATGTMEPGIIKRKKAGGTYRPVKVRQSLLLRTLFVDVQQGDATIIQLPNREVVIVDVGEAKFLARLLAAMFPFTSAASPLEIEAIVVTHGDADHFDGLIELEKAAHLTAPGMLRKRIFVKIRRFFHNGLVKGPGTKTVNGEQVEVPPQEVFGQSVQVGKEWFITDLWSDPCWAPSKSKGYTAACTALTAMLTPPAGSQTPVVERLQAGKSALLNALMPGGIQIEVLGPVVDQVNGHDALPVLRGPSGRSASQTINGHCVVLRLTHGNVSFLLGGDLNRESERRLADYLQQHPQATIRAEILKVPHHGSHDFDPTFLAQVAPFVSVVSSGDDNASREYVHPRANLLAALGRASRVSGTAQPLVFCTELAAFFEYKGKVTPEQHRTVAGGGLAKLPDSELMAPFDAFERLVWGAVRCHTDGQRVLVAVESASATIKEAYAFRVDATGTITEDTVEML